MLKKEKLARFRLKIFFPALESTKISPVFF